MMERLIRSPMPVPCSSVVKKASKILSAPWGSPTPVSLTDTISCCLSACRDLIATSRVPSSTSFIASMLLTMRFIRTCCNCIVPAPRSIFDPEQVACLQDDSLEHKLKCRWGCWWEFEYAKRLVRPVDFPAQNVPEDAAGVANFLSLGQISLTLWQTLY